MCFSFTCFEVWRFAEEQGDHRSIYNGAMMDFYKRARIVCLAIPYGEAATYGQIAMLCGKPKNARQVDLKRYGWKNTMEEALEFREIFEVQGI